MAMTPAGMGKGGKCPFPEMLFVLQMLSKVSVDEVFVHYFEKMPSASWGFAPRPQRGSTTGPHWGTSVL